MTIRLDALIEHWPGEHLLYVRALPGFLAAGKHPAELHRRSATALQAHLDWLVERDLIDRPAGVVELTVVEEAATTSDATGPRFVADLVAPDDEEIETALAVGRAAVSDLIEMYELASRSASAEAHVAALRQVAQHDGWCTSRIAGHGAPAVATRATDPVDHLIEAASTFEDEIDRFAASAEPDLFLRDGEEWTLAKLLRRRTGYLRQHLFRPITAGEPR